MSGSAIQLSNTNLERLSPAIQRPHYDRSAITSGIIHIGLGNFHRAHQAWYVHRLMQQNEAMDWGIIGAGVRPADEMQRKRIEAQDYLTTLIELDPHGHKAEITGSMIGFIPVEQDNASLIAQMTNPSIRIVSLTVTEGGYYLDPVSKQFDANHPDMQHDAAHPEAPSTAFGAIVAALRLRRDRGIGPFTGQSCDNLQGNGSILRQTIVSLARLSDPDLADWIDHHCSFPNAMVDCIVPATSQKEFDMAYTFGIKDNAPVTHENFRQWVIEDDFCVGRPHWDRVGATLTDDVHPYETMKIRILNGGHQLVANAGEIVSIKHISDCMKHPVIGAYFYKVATQEIATHVSSVSGVSAQDYVDQINRRFSNPEIVDTVRRVSFDGSSRHPGFILPTLRAAIALDSAIDGLALSQAIWARMCQGTREDGSKIEPNDPAWATLTMKATQAISQPEAWLKQPFYGKLASVPRFIDQFVDWHSLIQREGVESTLTTYLQR